MIAAAIPRMNMERFTADLANGDPVAWIVLLMIVGGVCHTVWKFVFKKDVVRNGVS